MMPRLTSSGRRPEQKQRFAFRGLKGSVRAHQRRLSTAAAGGPDVGGADGVRGLGIGLPDSSHMCECTACRRGSPA